MCKKINRAAALILAIMVGATALVGCASNNSSAATSASAATEAAGNASSGSTVSTEGESSAAGKSTEENETADASASQSSDASGNATTISNSASSASTSTDDTTKTIDPDKDIKVTGENTTDVKAETDEHADKDYAIHSQALTNIVDNEGNQPQIVVFGDSQFDNIRDESGLGIKLAYYTHCTVYNMAIGGTSASIRPNNSNIYPYDGWEDTGFVGMAYAATGQVKSDFLSNHYAYNVFKQCDFSKTDVFVIEYGVNDFLQKSGLNEDGNPHAYLGAMKQAINTLQQKYPKAKFVLCSATYAMFYDGNNFVGDSNILSNGYGTLSQYAGSAAGIADSMGLVKFDAYTWLNWNSGNGEKYLEDGIHMNAEGRELYAKYLARRVLTALGYDTPEGTDLSTFDYSTLKKTK